MMNSPENGICSTKGIGDAYDIEKDSNGNSILTGEGAIKKKFTCVELETYQVIF